MALFKSSVFTDIRGSIGGTTYARNRAGMYARNRTKPVNPNSPAQTAARGRFANAASAFAAISASQVLLWNAFAQLVPQFNSLGEEYTASAKQMFIQQALNLQAVGVTPLGEPKLGQTNTPSLDLSGATVSVETNGNYITTLDLAGIADGGNASHLVIQATPPLTAGKQSYRNRMRQVFGAGLNASPELITTYEAAFGGGENVPAEPGDIINLRLRAVNADNGLASAWYYLQGTVAAGV